MEYLTFFTLMSTVCAIYMVGVIWMVQLAHYPLMAHIEPESFKAYQRANLPSTTWVVMPVMMLEIFSTSAQFLALIWSSSPPDHLMIHWLSFTALGVVWLSTFVLQVPLHQKLLTQKDDFTLQRLVKTNWLRTAAWSFRAACLIFLTTQFIKIR